MQARSGTTPHDLRVTAPGGELALDLTDDEVVLYTGGAEGWRRFAGVALDDPQFLGVLELLRAEAEAATGGPAPVRLWLPAAQVLRLSVRLGPGTPSARLEAAFARAAAETGLERDELAVALGAPGPDGTSAVLVAYAATCREARDYAVRWGFRPGPVSTRHEAEGFGSAAPVFETWSEIFEEARGAVATDTRVGTRADTRADTGADSPAETPADTRAMAWLAVALALWAAPLVAGSGVAGSGAAWAGAPGTAPPPPERAGEAREETTEVTVETGVWQRASEAAAPGPLHRGETVSTLTLARLPGTPLPPARPGRAGRAAERAAPAVSAPAIDALPAAGGLAAPVPPRRPVRRPVRRGAAAPARVASVASSAPAGPAPAGATLQGLHMDRVALMGVLELESGRQALLRLPDGEIRTVKVGDMLTDWRVDAIAGDALRVGRDGQSRTLLLVGR